MPPEILDDDLIAAVRQGHKRSVESLLEAVAHVRFTGSWFVPCWHAGCTSSIDLRQKKRKALALPVLRARVRHTGR